MTTSRWLLRRALCDAGVRPPTKSTFGVDWCVPGGCAQARNVVGTMRRLHERACSFGGRVAQRSDACETRWGSLRCECGSQTTQSVGEDVAALDQAHHRHALDPSAHSLGGWVSEANAGSSALAQTADERDREQAGGFENRIPGFSGIHTVSTRRTAERPSETSQTTTLPAYRLHHEIHGASSQISRTVPTN